MRDEQREPKKRGDGDGGRSLVAGVSPAILAPLLSGHAPNPVATEQGGNPLLALLRYLLLLALLIAGLIFLRQMVRRSLMRRTRARSWGLLDDNWAAWDDLITSLLARHHYVTPAMLTPIPADVQLLAMRHYVHTHREQDLRLQLDPPCIEPARRLHLEEFAENWASLLERLTSLRSATPVAARLTEQLCELLGFSPLEQRAFKRLFGYMVKAPTVRLSIPPRFPIIFILQRDLHPRLIADLHDIMRVLNATAFFALLIVVGDQQTREDTGAARLKRWFWGGADDFIVLDYRDLMSLFLASDAVRRLVDIILTQVDLTMVSPYVTAGPVAENMFFGRDYELKTIMRTVRDRSFAIVGGRRIGKTSVLTQVQRLMEQTSGHAPFYLDCQYVTNYDEFFEALGLTCQLEIESTAPDTLRRAIIRLRRRSGNALIVLLLDEVDNLLAFDIANNTRLFRVFRALSQEGLCRFVFCGERQLNDGLHDPDSPLFNFCHVTRLSYLLPREARRMVQEPMMGLGIVFEDADALTEEILALTSCHPNLIQVICQMLIVEVNAREERIIRREDLERVRTSDEFRDTLLEVTWGNATALERLITVLMATRSQFTAEDMRQALGAQGCWVTGDKLEAALRSLVLFSILGKQGATYSFAARSFPKMVVDSHLREGLLDGLIEHVALERARSR